MLMTNVIKTRDLLKKYVENIGTENDRSNNCPKCNKPGILGLTKSALLSGFDIRTR
jgi:hypothetical protein